MAAKQGFKAHITQASEDARRAVISRAPTSIKSHSWLSNLNTTCTIKSAPPRTPEVMTLLANKSGWLVKRNEQQVWQRRWCCVVPHMFLYYFEAEPVREGESDDDYATREGFSGGGVYRSGAVVVENQDLLNAAVRDGCKSKSGRDSTPLKGRDANALYSPMSGEKMTPAPVRGPTTTSGNLSPAGIIDLECYSCVNRSTRNELVFELTGDEITNPDLRSFYFQAGSVEDCEAWTSALLSDRHSALRDEREAYRQVCDSFQLQLQNLSNMIDEAEAKTAETENKLYNVRSGAEKFRTQIVHIVREALEQKCWEAGQAEKEKDSLSEMEKLDQQLEKSRLFYMDQIDEVMSSENIGTTNNTGALITQILADYLATVVGSYTEMGVKVKTIEQKLNRSAGVDKAAVTDMRRKMEQLEEEKDERNHQYEAHIATLAAQMKELQKNNEELENQLQTQRVEFSMFQSQARSKLQELSSHKKILKKEVIELRKKIDQVGSERDAALHITDSHKVQAESEKEKNVMLEKYIERMENQVAVQQNMMEMISLSGMSQIEDNNGATDNSRPRSNSVVGRIISAPDDGSLSSFGPRHFRTLANNGSVRDASPYRLPPRNRVPATGDQPPLSPTRQKKPKRREEKSSRKSPKKSSKKKSKKKKSESVTKNTPRRGTLDDQLIDKEDAEEKKISVHKERVTRYQEAIHKNNGLDTSKNEDSTDNEGDDENKSTVSELTEDRTQRAYDSKLHDRQATIQYTMSEMTGENVIDGVPAKNATLSQSSEGKDNFPPRYIIGAPQDVSNAQDDDILSPKSANDSIASTMKRTKLSVAQKARLAAEQNGQGNKVDVSTEAETIRLNEAKQREHQLQPPSRTRSQSPGVFSNLASMITKRTDSRQRAQQDAKSNNGSGDVSLTLAERQKQQRERQLRVLREQGILKDGESSISGGAGAQSIRSTSTQKSR